MTDEDAFERKLYVVRKRAESEIAGSDIEDARRVLHSFALVPDHRLQGTAARAADREFLQGTLRPGRDQRFVPGASALFHQHLSELAAARIPTATSRTTARSTRCKGNVNWMHARQSLLESPLFGDDIKKLFPIIAPGGSDSANFDNAVELLLQAGRSLPHAMAMLIPEAWAGNPHMKPEKRAFYEYHASSHGALGWPRRHCLYRRPRDRRHLDRNGLRPGRYVVTHDDLVVMASEAGVLDIAPGQVKRKGRLQPGKMFLVDTVEGRIVSDKEIKQQLASRQPYAQWLKENQITIDQLPEPAAHARADAEDSASPPARVRLHR